MEKFPLSEQSMQIKDIFSVVRGKFPAQFEKLINKAFSKNFEYIKIRIFPIYFYIKLHDMR